MIEGQLPNRELAVQSLGCTLALLFPLIIVLYIMSYHVHPSTFAKLQELLNELSVVVPSLSCNNG